MKALNLDETHVMADESVDGRCMDPLPDDRFPSTTEAGKRRTSGEWIRVFGPSSLSNLGPGFDTLGLCIDGIGDYVEVKRTEEPGITIESISGDHGLLPHEPDKNTAAVAAQAVLERLGIQEGLRLRIEKQVPFGSGIGGSAASAVAGAWAANVAFGSPLDKHALVDAVLAGEFVASGGRHGDNVLPALFGGLVLVSSSDPARYRCIPLTSPLHLAVIVPQVTILTRQAREMLPRQILLRDAVYNWSELAFIIDAFYRGDWKTLGRGIMTDRIIEPVRATLVPCYQAVREAALDTGAYGCALTGSGPAMFAIAEDETGAAAALQAMLAASRAAGIDALGLVTRANPDGAKEV